MASSTGGAPVVGGGGQPAGDDVTIVREKLEQRGMKALADHVQQLVANDDAAAGSLVQQLLVRAFYAELDCGTRAVEIIQ